MPVDRMYWKCNKPNIWCCNNGGPVPKNERSQHINTTCCTLPQFTFQLPDPMAYTVAERFTPPVDFKFSPTTTFRDTTTFSNTTASSTGTNITSASSKGPSNNVAIGVGLGVGLGIGITSIAIVIFLLVRRKKSFQHVEITKNGPVEVTGDNRVEAPEKSRIYETHGHQAVAEAPGHQRYEMRA